MNQGIQRAVKFMEANFHSSISVQGMADMAGLSYHHFCRLFRAETGEPFVQKLARVRVEYAKELLATTSDPIDKIASRAGFGSSNRFYCVFRKFVDDTPMQYRRKILVECPENT